MSHEVKGKRKRPWVTDVKVFTAFAVLNLVLVYAGGICVYLSDWLLLGGGGVYHQAWGWVFAFPVMAAVHLEWVGLTNALIVLNPVIYGAMWWFVWKMFRLIRAKPIEGHSPTLDCE